MEAVHPVDVRFGTATERVEVKFFETQQAPCVLKELCCNLDILFSILNLIIHHIHDTRTEL